jgi:hypothetical protein
MEKYTFFIHKYKQYGVGAFDFRATGTDLLVFNVSILKGFTDNVSKIAPLNVISYYSPSNPSSTLETLYGATLLKDGGYYYIYISGKIPSVFSLHTSKVLRVAQNNLNGTKEYFYGYSSNGVSPVITIFQFGRRG